MSDRRVLRFEIPVGGPHDLTLPSLFSFGGVLNVGSRQEDIIELWVLDAGHSQSQKRTFQAFGTGEPIPDQGDMAWSYVGTTVTPSGMYVWHLFEMLEKF